jgi:putative DNA primase/helicase
VVTRKGIAGIELARKLVEAGIPVIAVGPDDRPRQKGWQQITAAESRLDLYREGDALAMVAGHGLDAVDVDTKAGGAVEHLAVPFTHFGTTRTPSGGVHYLVSSSGVGKISPLETMLGHVGDYCGGRADGTGRLLVFLPGSVRSKYPSGGYVMDEPWDIEGCLAAEPDQRLVNALLENGGTLVREQSAGTVATERRDPAEGVHPLARVEIDRILTGLDRLGSRSWYEGAGWDQATWKAACDLVRLANSGWTGYDLADAEQDLLDHAPADEAWGRSEHRAKWRSAVDHVGGATEAPDFRVEERAPVRGSLADADLAGRIVIEHLGGNLIAWGKSRWARWDGRKWDTGLGGDAVVGILARALHEIMLAEMAAADRQRDRRLAVGDPKAVAEHTARVKALVTLRSATKIKAVTTVIRGLLTERIEDFDGPRTYDFLNVGNGIVDLRTGKLGPHDRGMLFTRVAPVDYVEGARHPDWDKALRALPEDVREWMRLRFGQAATGYPPKDDVVPFLKGGGANGKSTLIEGVSGALGEFSYMASDKVLTAGTGEHSTETFELKGRRLVYIEELPQGNWVNANRLKKLAGTGLMSARPMREDPFEWVPTHSLMITTNHDTQISDTDHGTWRRLARVSFPFTFEGAEKDITLRSRVKGGRQAQAALAWIVEGAMRLYGGGDALLTAMPTAVVEDTELWRAGANVPAEFLGLAFEPKAGAAVPVSLVLRMFKQWAGDNGYKMLSERTFWERAEASPWFLERLVERKLVRSSSYAWPDGVEPKATSRAVVDLQLSDEGEVIRRGMTNWL